MNNYIDLNTLEKDIRERAHNKISQYIELYELNSFHGEDCSNNAERIYQLSKDARDKEDHMLHLIHYARQAERDWDQKKRDTCYALIEASLKIFNM
ncbi:hypothetical protein D3C80_1800860 [compost metagenome]